MGRGDLSDAEWDVIGPLLPPERGRWARPAGDNRRFLNGMLHVLRVGCPWRDMHERYGKWNSVYVRFRRWAERSTRAALEAAARICADDLLSTTFFMNKIHPWLEGQTPLGRAEQSDEGLEFVIDMIGAIEAEDYS